MRTRNATPTDNDNKPGTDLERASANLGLIPIKPGDKLPEEMRADSVPLFGNTGQARDRIVPMLRLMQGLSPQVQAGKAKAGELRLNLTNECVAAPPTDDSSGSAVKVVLLTTHAQAILYGPRDSTGRRSILAVSSDAEEWDAGYANRRVGPVKFAGREVFYDTGPNPRASGLMEWGTLNPFDDSNKAPALGVTYRMYLRLIEIQQFPVLFVLEKTATQSAREWLTGIDYRTDGGEGPAQQAQIWELSTYKKQDKGNAWFLPRFTPVDLAPPPALFRQMLAQAKALDALRHEVKGYDEAEEMTGGAAGGTAY